MVIVVMVVVMVVVVGVIRARLVGTWRTSVLGKFCMDALPRISFEKFYGMLHEAVLQ